VQAKAGAQVVVTIQASTLRDLFAAPFRVNYDPKLLRLVDVTRGPLMADGGQPVSFTRDAGAGTVRIARLPGSPGVSGSGALATLTFQALQQGTATVTIEDALLQDSKLQPVNATLAPLTITIVE